MNEGLEINQSPEPRPNLGNQFSIPVVSEIYAITMNKIKIIIFIIIIARYPDSQQHYQKAIGTAIQP